MISTLGAMAFVFVWGSWLAYWEEAWLVYPKLPVPVDNHEVKAGDTLKLTIVKFNKKDETRNYLVAQRLICDKATGGVTLRSEGASAPPGLSTVERLFTMPFSYAPDPALPEHLLPFPGGECYIEGMSELSGVIRRIPAGWTSEHFRLEASNEPH